MKRTWIYVAVAVAGALGGLAVTGLPAEVEDDLVITERPATPTTLGELGIPTSAAPTSADSGEPSSPADTAADSGDTTATSTLPATTAP
jgi:hypothetical protein